jgi:hypothetical protein
MLAPKLEHRYYHTIIRQDRVGYYMPGWLYGKRCTDLVLPLQGLHPAPEDWGLNSAPAKQLQPLLARCLRPLRALIVFPLSSLPVLLFYLLSRHRFMIPHPTTN